MNKNVLMISNAVSSVAFFAFGSTMPKIKYHGPESDK